MQRWYSESSSFFGEREPSEVQELPEKKQTKPNTSQHTIKNFFSKLAKFCTCGKNDVDDDQPDMQRRKNFEIK